MTYCPLSGLANPALDLHIQFLRSPNQLSLKRKWETPVSLGSFRNCKFLLPRAVETGSYGG